MMKYYHIYSHFPPLTPVITLQSCPPPKYPPPKVMFPLFFKISLVVHSTYMCMNVRPLQERNIYA